MTLHFVPWEISWHVIDMKVMGPFMKSCQSCVWMCWLTPNWNSTQRRNLPWGKGKIPAIWQKKCAVDVELLKMNLENKIPREGSFEGWLSVILGWGNWNALDRSPWSPVTFIKGSGLQRKIPGLPLSVCRLRSWISHGLITQSLFLPFKTIPV